MRGVYKISKCIEKYYKLLNNNQLTDAKTLLDEIIERINNNNEFIEIEDIEELLDEEVSYNKRIVIKKPNSQSYGIGLDACDICGETGYYERDGQVVCKLCDVVMNINTIGFKGGCNPIVVPYSIENSNIILPVTGLIEHENEFKS